MRYPESSVHPRETTALFNTLSNMFSGMFDSLHAPAEAFTSMVEIGVSSSMDEPTCDWTNDFGTACDFEVPASSCDFDAFSPYE